MINKYWIGTRARPGSAAHTWDCEPHLRRGPRPDFSPHSCPALELFDPGTFEVDGQSYVTVGGPFQLMLRVRSHLGVGFIQPPQLDTLLLAGPASSIGEQDALQRRGFARNQADLWEV